jgi:hypothetical protein
VPYTAPHPDEKHLDHLGVQVHGFGTSPYGIEWMRCAPHCPAPEVVRTVPHVAFVVDDLDRALRGTQVLIAPNSPSAGVRVAFILHDGAPVELMEFEDHSRGSALSSFIPPRSDSGFPLATPWRAST